MVLDWLARKIQSITKKEIKYTHARFEISAEAVSPLVFAGGSPLRRTGRGSGIRF